VVVGAAADKVEAARRQFGRQPAGVAYDGGRVFLNAGCEASRSATAMAAVV